MNYSATVLVEYTLPSGRGWHLACTTFTCDPAEAEARAAAWAETLDNEYLEKKFPYHRPGIRFASLADVRIRQLDP